ncbi:MAG: hypothetical protein B6D35_04530 [Candidatus Brocadia sp. UTAMX2]|jgi:monoamine oxidase|nr:MAG: hypothetical protein B6D35_04530 [Candidatus Brocadia sp. UTAMX2]
MSEHFDCIVLGAGIAGVVAARELKNAGKKVLILEATKHAGGRMRSMEDFVLTNDGREVREGLPIEEGAHFIHVKDGNPYKKYGDEIRQQGFDRIELNKGTKVRVAYPGDPDRENWGFPPAARFAHVYDSDLGNLGGLFNFSFKEKNSLFDAIKKFDLSKQDQTAGELVKTLAYRGKAAPMSCYAISAHTPGILATGTEKFKLCPPKHAGDQWCDAVNDNISVAGLKVDKIPEQIFDEQAEYRICRNTGNDKVICRFDELPNAILQEFVKKEPGKIQGQILYEHEVIKVEKWDTGVRITAGNGKDFTADSLLCTFSVGILMHKGSKIFGQFFPKEKQDVFQIIKPGPIAKISIQFKDCVWDYNQRINNLDNGMALLVNPTGPEQKILGLADKGLPRTFFTAFPNLENGPYVITALLMGVDYLIMKDVDDKKAVEIMFRCIEKIYNPHPERNPWDWKQMLVWKSENEPNVHRTDWGKDPWTRCGNSYISYGRSIAEIIMARETLKNPLATLPVFWAGEATAPAYDSQYQPLSVHGAYISGIEVAKDVDQFLMNRASFGQYYKNKYK